MPRFSVVLEGDKTYETYLAVAKTVDEAGFYSLQVYEHLPHKPAWGIALSLAPHVRKIKLGPATVPANLYNPVVNARFLAYLDSISPGALLGISRGAYMAGGRASVGEVVLAVQRTVEELRRTGWSKLADPLIYVGTSGPVLMRRAAAMPEVKGIVVDHLANPVYASEMRRGIDEAGGTGKELVARPFTFISENPEEVDLFFDELRRYVVDLVDGSPMLKAAGLDAGDLARADDEVRARMLENFALCGSVEEVVEKAVRLVRSGVSHVCFGHPVGRDIVEGVRVIAEKVLPMLGEQLGG
ncbi:MAG: LLM class flavin-dependent oxidoreductase [Candidatus Caldarchaeum sp.]